MKRFFIFITVSLIFLLVASAAVFAEEATLIDFSTLVEDADGENEATMIDFSTVVGTNYSEEEKTEMKTSLKVENWEVDLASSSKTVDNERLSYVMPTVVSENSRYYAGDTVMGVRIHFPEQDFNSWAIVEPPFEIPTYMTNENESSIGNNLNMSAGSKFDGYGVVKNVGPIKEISMNIIGRNFPHLVGLVINDNENRERQITMDYLDFAGWRNITWSNPNYINDVRNRELRKRPMYPETAPTVKLLGIIFYRDKDAVGSDFVTYIKDIGVVFDKAILDDVNRDVDDEAVWGILSERERNRRNTELKMLGEKMVLRILEQKKMHLTGSDEETGSADATGEAVTE